MIEDLSETLIDLTKIKKISLNAQTTEGLSYKFHQILVEYTKFYFPDTLTYEQGYFPFSINLKYKYSDKKLQIELENSFLGKYQLGAIPLTEENDMFTYVNVKKIPEELIELFFLLNVFVSKINISNALKVFEKVLPFYDGQFKMSIVLAEISLKLSPSSRQKRGLYLV